MFRAVLFACVLLTASDVFAQASFDVQLFRPSPHSDAFITVESGAVVPKLGLRGQLFLNYANQPLALFNGAGTRISSLDHRLDMDIAGAVSLFDRLSIALSVPATLFQGGSLPSGTTPFFRPAAFGDLRLSPKVNILEDTRFHIDLAALLFLTVPTATKSSFAGDPSVQFGGEIDLSKRYGPVRGAINYGFVWRAPSVYYDLVIGPEMYARAGVGFDIGWLTKQVPIEIIAEVYGRTSLTAPFRNAAQNPMEGILGAKVSIIEQVQLTFGAGRGLVGGYGAPVVRAFLGLTVIPIDHRGEAASVPASEPASAPVPVLVAPPKPKKRDAPKDKDGDGVLDVIDQCKDQPEDKDGWADDDGCPELDNDNDGKPDLDDKCPNEAEDKDGFQDEDGCPEIDNDGDGIRDVYDRCPLEAEVINGVDDEDGCPDRGKSLVVVTKNAIQILEKVQFQRGSDLILPKSFPLLDQVAAVLKNHVEIKQLRVEGHTDSDGNDQANLALSQRRANAVAEYLVVAGIDRRRLIPKGYGETKPIAPNTSAKGKEQNRRVAFTVIEEPPPEKKDDGMDFSK